MIATRPRILSVAQAFPPYFVEQDTLLAAFRELWGKKHFNLDRLEQLHRAVRVGGRHLALPIERYAELGGFGARNDAWIEVALELGERVLRDSLARAGLTPRDLDHLF